MDQVSKIIELVGMPGSGKSSIVQGAVAGKFNFVLFSGLKAESHGPVAILRRVTKASTGAILYPGLLIALCPAILFSRQRSIADILVITVNILEVSWWMNRRRNAGTAAIFDQGPFQAIWSIAWSANTITPAILKIFRYMPLPNLVVKIDVSMAETFIRTKARAGRKSRVEQSDDLLDVIKRSFRANVVLKSAVNRWSHRHITIRNDTISTATCEMEKVLFNYFASQNQLRIK